MLMHLINLHFNFSPFFVFFKYIFSFLSFWSCLLHILFQITTSFTISFLLYKNRLCFPTSSVTINMSLSQLSLAADGIEWLKHVKRTKHVLYMYTNKVFFSKWEAINCTWSFKFSFHYLVRIFFTLIFVFWASSWFIIRKCSSTEKKNEGYFW